MELKVSFRREDHKKEAGNWTRDTTVIWIDVLVDGTNNDISPKLFISGPTSDIGHLDPNVHSMADYREAMGMKAPRTVK